jgi:hypothetical protein
VVNMLRRRCEELAERHPGFRTACFTPHDWVCQIFGVTGSCLY